MKTGRYDKGNAMTFPLELTEIKMEHVAKSNRYLYPLEVQEIQKAIEEACDRIEYDGSLMYDEYPDKISVELMATGICKNCKCKNQSEISNRFFHALVQTML